MSYTVFLSRVGLALVLGFFIGLERQLTGHPAGIRINVLICMGTSFFTLFPILHESTEVYRVGSAIISGVGFLCSGVIFKENGYVRGMNTAATLWCTAAIGILATDSSPVWAVLATAVLILSNLVLRPMARKLTAIGYSEEQETAYKISVVCLDAAEPEIRHLLINSNTSKTLFLRYLESGDMVGGKTEVVAEFCSVGKTRRHLVETIVGGLLKHPKVISAGWEIL